MENKVGGDMTKKKRSNGKYHQWITKEGLLKIEGWARDGLVDKQIAHNIGIAEQTLNVWKKKYPSLSESLKRGKEVVDREVENALRKRALGYKYEEIKIEESDNGEKITRTMKEVIPDTTAQIFWLRNRKNKDWSNKDLIDIEKAKAEIEHTQEKTKLLTGIKKDTSILEALIDLENEEDE